MKINGWKSLVVLVLVLVLGINMAVWGSAAADAAAFRNVQTETQRNWVFTFPVPTGYTETQSGEGTTSGGAQKWQNWVDESGKLWVHADVTAYKKVFSVDEEMLRGLYDNQTENTEGLLWQEELMMDRFYPARMAATALKKTGEDGAEYTEFRVGLLYFCGSTMLHLYYETREAAEALEDESLQPKAADWKPLLELVHYSVPANREGLPDWLVTLESFITALTAKDGQRAVAAGKTLQILSEPQEADRIKAMDKSALSVMWLLLDAEQARAGKMQKADPAVASLSSRGVLKGGNVTEITPVVVLSYNRTANFQAAETFLIVPAQKKLTISEKKLTLYAGESEPVTLQVAAEPENTLLFSDSYTNISWTADKADLLKVNDLRNGSAQITPLKAGKAKVTVKDQVSGKSDQASVEILTPVTAVEISGPETVKAGKSAAFKAVLTPEKPSNKKVAWTLEAGGDFATLGKDGKLSVKKDAPAGTEIVIVCRAEGSSMERTARKTVVVE